MYQCTKCHSQEHYHNQVIAINISLQVLLPEAVCCCLQTCMLNVLVGTLRFIVIGINTSQ